MLNEKITSKLEDFEQGWLTFWTDKYKFPETNIQAITQSEFHHHDNLKELVRREKRKSFGSTIHAEHALPFTEIDKKMVGDRYGEEAMAPNSKMDYYCQTPSEVLIAPEIFNNFLVSGERDL